jgi:hypothetical protein
MNDVILQLEEFWIGQVAPLMIDWQLKDIGNQNFYCFI